MIARVLIDGPSELVFDYAIPADLPVVEGCRVRVPIRQKTTSGTVLSVIPPPEQSEFAVRELKSLIDPEPLITPVLLKIARWISNYYGSSIESVIRSILPEAVRTEDNSAKTRRIATAVEYISPEDLEKLEKRAAKQYTILTLLHAAEKRTLPTTELGDNSAPSLKSLASKGFIKITTEEVRRDPEAEETIIASEPLVLNDQQQETFDAVNGALALAGVSGQNTPPKGSAPFLLLGVTGSGKTEVYLQSAQAALDLGKTVLVLVPEIALTPQTVRRFKARFSQLNDQVAVLHSHLSQGERFDEWHRIRKGTARIVIGARSAVFAPLPDLGLIIIDEEHESTYKQENVPRYQARDVAVLRAAFEQCTIILGSATPSLESWQNAQTGKYQLLRLDKRADSHSMPLVRVIDMRLEKQKQKGQTPILSDRLRAALEQRLEKGEQSILFLNRRGFARSLQCHGCGHVCECPHCAVALTYHRTDERLVCHVCGHQSIVPRKCPECKNPGIALQGYGTQKVEEILQKVLPEARFARIDADAMRRKNALKDILRKFKSQKIDILIGTQMIAKGLHFPNVTLVGILNADLGLHVPDFRAGERTFQLITQVAGRAGRGELEGEVIVQTFTPHSPQHPVRPQARLRWLRRAGDGNAPPVPFPPLRPLWRPHRPLHPRTPCRVHPPNPPPTPQRKPPPRHQPRRSPPQPPHPLPRPVPLPDHPPLPQSPPPHQPRPIHPPKNHPPRRRHRRLRHGRV